MGTDDGRARGAAEAGVEAARDRAQFVAGPIRQCGQAPFAFCLATIPRPPPSPAARPSSGTPSMTSPPAACSPDTPAVTAHAPCAAAASAPSSAHFPAATPANTPQLTAHARSTITAVHATSGHPRNAAATPMTSAISAAGPSACDAAIAPFAARGRSDRDSSPADTEPPDDPRAIRRDDDRPDGRDGRVGRDDERGDELDDGRGC